MAPAVAPRGARDYYLEGEKGTARKGMSSGERGMRGRRPRRASGVVVCTAEGDSTARAGWAARLVPKVLRRPQVRGPAGQGTLDLMPEWSKGLGVFSSLPEGWEFGARDLARQETSTELRWTQVAKAQLLASHASPPAVCGQVWEKLAWRGRAGSALGPGGKEQDGKRTWGSGSSIFAPTQTGGLAV